MRGAHLSVRYKYYAVWFEPQLQAATTASPSGSYTNFKNLPKVSISTRRSFHQDGKKRSRHRGHQYYRDATKVWELRKTFFKGIVQVLELEVIEPTESGKPRTSKRTPKDDIARFGYEENWPVSAPKNRFYLGSTDDDVDMKFVDEATVELPNCFVPTMLKSFQPQSENQIFYS